MDKGTTVTFGHGKKTLSLEDLVWLEETVASEPFTMTTIRRDWGTSDNTISGDEYEGYIVLVTHGGEIFAKASNSFRYLDEEWLEKCK
jgi:hypothetical protein